MRPARGQAQSWLPQRVRISMAMMPQCVRGTTQVNSPKKDFSQRGAGRKSLRTLNEVTYQNMVIVATQASEHHRHSALIRYSDSNCSQVTKPTPNRVPK